MDTDKGRTEDLLVRILSKVEQIDKLVHEIKENFIKLSKKIASHLASIKELENQMGQISARLDAKPKSDSTVAKPQIFKPMVKLWQCVQGIKIQKRST